MDETMNMDDVVHEMEDRISQLPIHLIERILDLMPLVDVVRTSILSKTWRYVWATFQKLELDNRFFQYVVLKNPIFPLVVYKILSVYFGPIQKFHLFIPNNIGYNYISGDLDCWMHQLSKRAIEDLHLDNSHKKNQPYKLPRCIFNCPCLKCLTTNNCLLQPPHGFGGFCNLTKLCFYYVSFASANTFDNLLPSAPALRRLFLVKCIGTVHLRVCAPRFQYLCVNYGLGFCFDLCGSFPSLEQVFICCKKFDNPEDQNKNKNLNELLSKMAGVWKLLLCGASTLQLLNPGVKRLFLEARHRCLSYLELWDVQFEHLSQMRVALCVIRSSPSLRILILKSSKKEAVGEGKAIEYLEKLEPSKTITPSTDCEALNREFIESGDNFGQASPCRTICTSDNDN